MRAGSIRQREPGEICAVWPPCRRLRIREQRGAHEDAHTKRQQKRERQHGRQQPAAATRNGRCLQRRQWWRRNGGFGVGVVGVHGVSLLLYCVTISVTYFWRCSELYRAEMRGQWGKHGDLFMNPGSDWDRLWAAKSL